MENYSPNGNERFKKWSLNSALAFLIIWTILFTVGVLGSIKYLKSGDNVGVLLDVANTFLGIIGIVLGCHIIRAVDARLISESRASLGSLDAPKSIVTL
jgi:hypothetical protein